MLAVNNIEVVYDGVILVLRGVSLAAEEGHITTLLGANGAGKTTTLKAISGLLHAERGQVTKGNVALDGERLDRLLPHDVVKRGIVQVFEGRRVFENLTVEENLIAGAHAQPDRAAVQRGIDRVYSSFAVLKERRHISAGTLSKWTLKPSRRKRNSISCSTSRAASSPPRPMRKGAIPSIPT